LRAVRPAVSVRTRSLTAAARCGVCCNSSLTSITPGVKRASLNWVAFGEVATAIRQVKADATAMDRVRAVLPNSFSVLSRMLVIRGIGRRCWLVYWQFASVEVRVRETSARYLFVASEVALVLD